MVNDETLIIKRVLAGNTNAFATLVDRYKDLAITLATSVLLNTNDAEDIVQDAFIKAFTALPNFKGNAKFSTWFYRIVLNTAINKQKGRRLENLSADDLLAEEANESMAPDLSHYTAQQQRKFIQQALQHLSEGERLCITLHYLNELSLDEIKELTNYSLSNIKVLLFRGRKQLYCSLKSILKTEIKDLM